MVFETDTFDFGKVVQGLIIRHNFIFTNKGKEPLVIENCATGDGGSYATWMKDPILPGKQCFITILQNTTGKMGRVFRVCTITSNDRSGARTIVLKGEVVLPEQQSSFLKFDSVSYNFGTVKPGTIIKHEFYFVNTGTAPAVITSAWGSSEAVFTQWPGEPISPGKTGVVTVNYVVPVSSGKVKKQVTGSTSSGQVIVLTMEGIVEERK